jgi:hypothetical protein
VVKAWEKQSPKAAREYRDVIQHRRTLKFVHRWVVDTGERGRTALVISIEGRDDAIGYQWVVRSVGHSRAAPVAWRWQCRSSGRNLLLASSLYVRGQRVEIDMKREILKAGAVLALLLASSASSYADDPTGILLQERGQQPTYPGRLPRFSDGGPCYKGMHQQAFPNAQGYRCYRNDVR